jgi:hypothetical protein
MNRQYERSHPRPEDLALAARGDLSLVERWRVNRHVRRCPECERELDQFHAVSRTIKRQAEAGALTSREGALDWQRLEREMIGNIKVGIAAAQCIGDGPGHVFHRWKVPALVAGLSLLFVAGWLINVPRDDRDRVMTALRTVTGHRHPTAGLILETNPHGVSVRFQGTSLTLLHPASARATASFTSSSSVGVRYVDDETGQVTIANVYGRANVDGQ